MKTVHHHRSLVRKHCFRCGLYKQGILHDLSKYSPSELWESIRYFQGDRSPYSYERQLFGYAPGWLHHQGRNKHHWEYWYDLIDGKWQPLKMPTPYFIEMACDRIAACKTYQKDQYTDASPLKYLQSRTDHLYMHPDTARQLTNILTDLATHGENYVFMELKNSYIAYKKQN